jgi:uncharacterized protein YigA (DUF484 family)
MSQPEDLSEQAVADYLRGHLDFFTRHEDLLARLSLPHTRGKTVSLVERQVTVLRDENQQLQRQLDNLIAMAKRNEELNQRIQNLITTLLGAADFPAFLDTLYRLLREDFHNDAVGLRLFGVESLAGHEELPEFAEYDAEVFALFEDILKSPLPVCGRLQAEQLAYFFAGQKIGSAVLIPIGSPEAYGILALGCQDVARYAPSMATDFLAYLGKLLGQMLAVWQKR